MSTKITVNKVTYFQFRETPYYLSKVGIVFNSKSNKIQKLNKQVSNSYLYVMDRSTDVSRMLYVHKMMAELFHKVVDGVNHVDHINGDKQDNRAINLRFVTKQENIAAYFEKYREGLVEKTKRVRISEEERSRIVELQALGWGNFKIGRDLGRKAETIFFYCKRHNLVKTTIAKEYANGHC